MIKCFIESVFVIQILLVMMDIANNTILSLKNKDRISLSIRMILSISFVISALLIYCSGRNIKYSIFIFIGTIFSFFGDLTMASLIKFNDRIKAGIAFFAVTHILYISAYLSKIIEIGINAYIFISLIGIYFIVMIILIMKNKKILKNIAVFGYGALIILMAVFSAILAITGGGAWIITFFAAVSFVISDSLIAAYDIMEKKICNSDLLIWITYSLAQIGIIYSAIL